jgi:hypothetical protein
MPVRNEFHHRYTVNCSRNEVDSRRELNIGEEASNRHCAQEGCRNDLKFHCQFVQEAIIHSAMTLQSW